MTVNIRHGKNPLFLESLVLTIVSPVQSLFTQTITSISDMFDHYFFLVAVSQENDRLRLKIDRLRKDKNTLMEQVSRQDRLAKLIDQEASQERLSVVATVIGRDATQWSRVVIVDKGTNHGVRENFAVVTNAGIVGHVIQSSGNYSKVMLITDSRSAVDSLFQGTRINGVVVGTGEEVCNMQYVPTTADAAVGDRIFSSGLGGIFPKGLMVGTVGQVVKKKQGLFQDIKIIPSADFFRLEEVLILLP